MVTRIRTPDYGGILLALGRESIDKILFHEDGAIKLSLGYREYIDAKKGSYVIDDAVGKKVFPGEFGFVVAETTGNENFVFLIPGEAS